MSFTPLSQSSSQLHDLRVSYELHELDLKTRRAWHYRQDFRHFWDYLYTGAAG
jgi:hypothetical protein